jgi:proline racemase
MRLKNQIFAIDHHHGQASRTVLSGYPFIEGKTMRDKADYYLAKMSWVHESLIREPRGHRNMLGSIMTAPVNPGSAFGALFLHAYGLFDACGDSTFATASAALETGLVKMTEPITRFSFDTVLGPLHVEADVADGVLTEVRFENVPSYYVGRKTISVPEVGEVTLEVAFGGLFFGFIDAKSIPLTVAAQEEKAIIAVAQRIFSAVGPGFDMVDEQSGKQVPLDLITFVEKDLDQPNSYIVANVYKPGRMGRTPSGTGTSAHIALRAALGEYNSGEKFVQRSIVGTHFTGTAAPYTLPSGKTAVKPIIGAKSYMMAISQFVIDPEDPFGTGFILEG